MPTTLAALLSQFRQLQKTATTVQAKAQRGLAFERLLSELFRQQGVLATDPFRTSGEQIDGAFEYKGWTYLVEAKWSDKKKSTEALYSFQGKPDRRIEGTRGLFISMSGYHQASLERFSRGRKPNTLLWTGKHIEAVLESKVTLSELLDMSVRHAAERSELLLPLDAALSEREDQLFQLAIEASASQVNEEISVSIGRKFIPTLYVQRSIEQRLSQLLHPERELNDMLDELVKAGTSPQQIANLTGDPASDLTAILRYLREYRTHGNLRSNDRLRLLAEYLPETLMGRLHVITSKAGMGKTNLLCHLAKTYAREQPTVFLSARSGITGTASLTELIESRLLRHLRDPFPRDWCFAQIVSLARARHTSLLVIIDALNEHKDFDVVNATISHFLMEIADLPVIVLASCRDVYWPFFDTSTWARGQWKTFDQQLEVFSPTESQRAVAAYFDFYHLRASLNEPAKEKLSHPLILRFFCETYGNPDASEDTELYEIPDIRLKILFDHYLKRKLDSICYTSPRRFRTHRASEEFLFALANQMRANQSREIGRNALPTLTAEGDLDSPESTYVSILGEDILLEEEPDRATGSIKVVFTYDEFMEYMIARSMLRFEVRPENLARQLVAECENGAEAFPSFVGVFEYLAVILCEDYQCPVWEYVSNKSEIFAEAVCRAIAKLGAEFLGTAELNALDNLVNSECFQAKPLSIQLLGTIAAGLQYAAASRIQAVEILGRVLAEEEDAFLRAEAITCFERGGVASVSDLGCSIDGWWRSRKEDARRASIVVSDDELEIEEIYQDLLEEFVCEKVYRSHNAETAIELAKTVKPALLITDMTKPGISGEEMATILKKMPETSSIRILLITGQHGKEHLKWRASGLFCATVMKPFGLEDTVRIVQMCLAGRYENNFAGS